MHDDLLFHQQAGDRGQEVRDAFGRGVRAVRRAEGVVDEHVAQAGQLAGEAGVVGFLFGVKAHVLEQHDVARRRAR